jgi:LysM repeat protein
VTATPAIPPTTTYVVKKGDTLYGIATTYGTTVAEIKRINGLTSNSLKIGQKLQVPQT